MDASQCARDPTRCASIVNDLNDMVSSLNNSLIELQTEAAEDPCMAVAGEYDVGLHVMAIFVVLVASLLGVSSTLLGKHWSVLRLNPYVVMLGKATGTGVVISCGFIHMLLPSNESLTSECVPLSWSSDYEAYAYLFAIIAALVMHHLELLISHWFSGSVAACNHHSNMPGPAHLPSTSPYGGGGQPFSLEHMKPDEEKEAWKEILEDGESLTSAIMAEFAFSVHSIFIGLAVGVVGDDEMKALLTALCFHQLFEGISLGARLSDAKLPIWTDWAMAITFSISAPIGIATVVGLVTASDTFNPAGATFLITQGVFDGLCAGILIYIGFSMLVRDLPNDLQACSGQPFARARKLFLLFALWTGMGMMALIGKFL